MGPIGANHRGTTLVLVVDDDDSVRRAVARLIQVLRYPVISVHDSIEALRALADLEGPLILLTDVRLQGLSGLGLAHEAVRAKPGLPVILMTGDPDGIPDGLVPRRNLVGVLRKPFQIEQLEALLERAHRKAG